MTEGSGVSKVFVARERRARETRVAATPETVGRYVEAGLTVLVERGAGAVAHFSDEAYVAAGAALVDEPTWDAEIILTVQGPSTEDAGLIRAGALVVGFITPHRDLERVRVLRDRRVHTLAMELIPRVSRAQSMDALSSQASIAGYEAVLRAASALDKYFPLLMTAAGTVKPARVVVMGAGVAGLQAIATARRLGAIVYVSDIREAVREQVESLGGRFIDLPDMGESGDGAGGYAREVTPEFLRRQREIVSQHVARADAVITTALVPGRPAPKLVTAAMVESMRTGAVIVDLAVEQGGNCELSEMDAEVVRHGVVIIGHSNLAATMPMDASTLFARNTAALLRLVLVDGAVRLDLDDEIIAGALLTHDGVVRHAPTAASLAGS